MNLTQNAAYQALSNFLKQHKGKKMKVAVHAYNICFETNLINWDYQDTGGIICIVDDTNAIEVYNGNNEEITGYTTDPSDMSVFPYVGNFELKTEYSSIAFRLL
ncbi:hypothetical protein [Cytobacillus gottheilii]|uniref:hypothetical protein n=1 Tax=Cytobacillus gottheilii TaxID=859144 RepID=UPI0009B960B3|nr:hypothetical protein [Cytobacillus gottheilii]